MQVMCWPLGTIPHKLSGCDEQVSTLLASRKENVIQTSHPTFKNELRDLNLILCVPASNRRLLSSLWKDSALFTMLMFAEAARDLHSLGPANVRRYLGFERSTICGERGNVTEQEGRRESRWAPPLPHVPALSGKDRLCSKTGATRLAKRAPISERAHCSCTFTLSRRGTWTGLMFYFRNKEYS